MLPGGLVDRLRALKRETHALFLAARHERTPWPARIVVAVVVAYALSPIDLVPDFIPVLGYLDDLVLVPLGIALAMRLIPADVMAECRARAEAAAERPSSRVAAFIIVGLWIVLAALAIRWAMRAFG